MLLVEFFNTPEGDSYAEPTPTSRVTETKRKITAKNDPCWKGYHMVGTKSKGGKEVPNCVPGSKGSMNEDYTMSDVVWARELMNRALRDSTTKHEYFDFLKSLREKHGPEYSTRVHQQAAKLTDGSKE